MDSLLIEVVPGSYGSFAYASSRSELVDWVCEGVGEGGTEPVVGYEVEQFALPAPVPFYGLLIRPKQ